MPTRAVWAHHLPVIATSATPVPTDGTDAMTRMPADGVPPTPDPPPVGEEERMISFSVEGGFTNQIRSLRIDPDGAALVDVSGRSGSGQLDAARVEAIRAELDASRLFDRDRTYPAPAGADQQRFEITYDGATIVAYDGTVPPELTGAVRLLEESLRDAQR